MAAVDEKSLAVIRAMAQTLIDEDVDTDDCIAVCTRLMVAGWPATMVEQYYESVVRMVVIRSYHNAAKNN